MRRGTAAPPLRRARAVRLRALPAASRRRAARALRGGRGALRFRVGPRLPARLPAPRRGGRPLPPRRRRRPAGRPILAFTATATPEVRDDIVALLGLREPRGLRRRVRPAEPLPRRPQGLRRDREARAPARARRRPAGPRLRRDAQERRARRRGAARRPGVAAEAYHAGLDEAERTRVQNRFADGSLARRLRDERLRHGHRPARHRGRRALRDPRLARGLLPGDRPRRPRRAPRGRDAALELRGRAHAGVPDRADRRARFRRGRAAPGAPARARPQQARADDRATPTRPAATARRSSATSASATRPRACGFCGNCARRRELVGRGPAAAAQDPLRAWRAAASAGASARSWRC